MAEFEKAIDTDERKFRYGVTKDSYIATQTIKEGFFEGDEFIKSYTLCRYDDFFFEGWNTKDNTKNLSFSFDVGHVLYLPLLHLLNYDDQLVIDDDDTLETNKKCLVIKKKGPTIYLTFYDKTGDKDFRVFIKNILYDLRSKIDRNNEDTKGRLHLFFNAVNSMFVTGYTQTTLEEQFAAVLPNEEMQKVFKIDYSKKK